MLLLDAPSLRRDSLPRKHDTRQTPAPVDREVEEADHSGTMDARGPTVADGRAHGRVYALERDGV